MSQLVVESISGAAIAPYIPTLSALRIEVFRAYPYLYEGSLDYERKYLSRYLQSSRAVVVLARDGEQVVGASTALPLSDHEEELVPALSGAGYDPAAIYYFGESVLRAEYRGRGIGHAFFDQREAAARQHGFSVACFCAVERAADHPARPRDYQPLDAFWQKRGYQKRPDIVTTFSWCDVGDQTESEKQMVFWLKELAR